MNLAKRITDNEELTKEILDLIKEANQAIIRIYNRKNQNLKIKSNNTPVTEADLASNKLLTSGIKKIFPQIPIVSEENDNSLSIPQHNNVFWLIDPLDGTKEFINKNDEFTCNLALIENNYTILGFVGVPVKNLIYYGGKELSSKCIDENYHITMLKCKSNYEKYRVVASKSHLNAETKNFIKNLNKPTELVQAGSSLKFIKIAEGLADIYPRIAPTCEWDTAAAHAILEGAGGTVTNLKGEDLKYGKSDILNPFFVAKGIN